LNDPITYYFSATKSLEISMIEAKLAPVSPRVTRDAKANNKYAAKTTPWRNSLIYSIPS